MKKFASLLLLCSMLIFMGINAWAKTSAESLDDIVAIVNDDVITRSEVHVAMARVKMQLQQEQSPEPSASAFQKQVIEQLIDKKLQLQTANQLGIKIPDTELDKTIQTVAEQNNTTVTELYRRLQQEHMSVTEYRNEIREQMTLQKIQQQEVAGKIAITPAEVKSFMRSHPIETNTTKEYHLEDILIPLSETPSSKELAHAKQKADEIIAQFNSGQSFQASAKIASNSQDNLTSNDLGWRKLQEMPSIFTDYVAKMQIGEITGPIQAPNGFHIVHLIKKRSIGNSGTSNASNLKQVENILLQQKFEEAVQNWISKLRGQAYINLKPKPHENS